MPWHRQKISAHRQKISAAQQLRQLWGYKRPARRVDAMPAGDPTRSSSPYAATINTTKSISVPTGANPLSQPRPATLGFVRRSGDAVSKLDWAGDGAERLEAFAGAKDRHIAIVEHAPED
jgi:hypothetical protein